MDNNKKIDSAFKLLDNVQNVIRFADTKINVLLVISGVTTTFIVTNFQSLYDASCFSKITLGLFFLIFIIFVILSLQTIYPRTDNYSGNSPVKINYFNHVAKRVEAKDLVDDFNKLTDESFLNDILYQVYENSKIASKKFSYYKKSMFVLQIQILFFFLLLILKYFN